MVMNMKNLFSLTGRNALRTASLVMVLASDCVSALPAVPVYLKPTAAPNILFTLDDSGSMAWSWIPDSISGDWPNTRFLAAAYNPLAYDPAVDYPAPPQSNGTKYSTSFTAAWGDGFRQVDSVNLSTVYDPVYDHYPGAAPTYLSPYTGVIPQAAYYYLYDATLVGCAADINANNCYRKVVVSATSGTGARADERQNFANWYSFYKVRHLTAKSGLLTALANLDPLIRVGWQALNTCNTGFGTTVCANGQGVVAANRLAPFSGTHRDNFYNWISVAPASNSTPLRSAFVRAGDYYKVTGVDSPYANVPGTTEEPKDVCRLSYHVALTDGIWNSDPDPGVLNADNIGKTMPDGIAYVPAAPFKDANSESIADVAFKYWSNDLQSGMTNSSPAYSITGNKALPNLWPASEYWDPRNNPATWQHMVNYTIGLGLNRSLADPKWQGSTFSSSGGDGWVKFASGASAWPATGSNTSPGNVYDLWHAAINSRGDFFSATKPNDVYEAFNTILGRISGLAGSSGSLASSGSFIFSDSAIYAAEYSSGGWSGSVAAFVVTPDGGKGAQIWNTDSTLTTRASPNLWIRAAKTTANPNPAVVKFNWAALNADTRGLLKTEDIAGWLVGKRDHEQNNATCTADCTLRARTKLLGDILGSSPVLSAREDFGYANFTWTGGGTSYLTYLATKKTRAAAVIVGANDGFVHVFDAANGSELFGYAPGAVVPNLWRLTEPTYSKKAYVDGPITVGDAYTGTAWKTLAIGALGPGGKSVYALDLTNPTSMNASSVLWEFTDVDLGHVLSRPLLTRLPNGTWVSIFSGGYETPDSKVILYTVDAFTGSLISKAVLQPSLTACGASATGLANGLGAIKSFRTKGGQFYVYGGDLLGNFWRFESGTASTGVTVSHSGVPFFKACNAASASQAITAAPTITSFGAQPLVFVGTGRLFDTGDASLTTRNSIYALIDDNVAVTASRSDALTEQTILSQSATARVTSFKPDDDLAKRGWFIDLQANGERVLAPATLIQNRVAFNTFVPLIELCQSNGYSWLMQFDQTSGSNFDVSVFDVNGDGKINNLDLLSSKVVSGVRTLGTIGALSAISVPGNPKRTVGSVAAVGDGACIPPQLALKSPKLYESGLNNNCTPSASARSGWRQLK
jgi:type IV pilus assembly protein PilY1